METILSTYNGHTIFSIYSDWIKVYEAISEQLEKLDLDEEEDRCGNMIEH